MANKGLYGTVVGLLNIQQDSWGCKTLPQRTQSHMTEFQMVWRAQRAGYLEPLKSDAKCLLTLPVSNARVMEIHWLREKGWMRWAKGLTLFHPATTPESRGQQAHQS